MARWQIKPSNDPNSWRVFVGRMPIGFVTKFPQGWLPDGGVPTDYRATKEAAAERLLRMKGYGPYVDGQ